MIRADYFCEHCDSDQEHAVPSPLPDFIECEFCGEQARWSPSPVMGRVRKSEVARGKWQKPEHPGWVDTRELGEGQPIEEYRAKRRKIREELRWKANKDL